MCPQVRRKLAIAFFSAPTRSWKCTLLCYVNCVVFLTRSQQWLDPECHGCKRFGGKTLYMVLKLPSKESCKEACTILQVKYLSPETGSQYTESFGRRFAVVYLQASDQKRWFMRRSKGAWRRDASTMRAQKLQQRHNGVTRDVPAKQVIEQVVEGLTDALNWRL